VPGGVGAEGDAEGDVGFWEWEGGGEVGGEMGDEEGCVCGCSLC
jgi:hypothetical protein